MRTAMHAALLGGCIDYFDVEQASPPNERRRYFFRIFFLIRKRVDDFSRFKGRRQNTLTFISRSEIACLQSKRSLPHHSLIILSSYKLTVRWANDGFGSVQLLSKTKKIFRLCVLSLSSTKLTRLPADRRFPSTRNGIFLHELCYFSTFPLSLSLLYKHLILYFVNPNNKVK